MVTAKRNFYLDFLKYVHRVDKAEHPSCIVEEMLHTVQVMTWLRVHRPHHLAGIVYR